MFFAVVAGVVLGQVASRITQYFTSSSFKPVRDIADSGMTGPATVVLSGISSGMESAVWAVVAIAGRDPRRPSAWPVAAPCFAFYLVALVGIGMLATTGIVVAEDTFGPIADNAQGIAEMSDELEGETETILDGLDTVGNTTKAVTKGFAIGSAVIAAVALFASFRETIAAELGVDVRRDRHQHRRPEDVRRWRSSVAPSCSCSRRSPSWPWAAPPASSCRRSAASSGRSPGSWTTPRSPTTGPSSTSAPAPRCAS